MVQAYLADNADKLVKNKLREKSVIAYDKAATDFRDSVQVKYMDEITDKVLLDYETWLLENLQRRRVGKRENTIVNRFRYLTFFYCEMASS
jgi:hypothetical protein